MLGRVAYDDALPIVTCGSPVLRRPAETVDPADVPGPAMARLIAQMRVTMRAAPGVGLAAPQVGVPLRIAVLEDGPQHWGGLAEEELSRRGRVALPFTVMVNPALEPLDDEVVAFYEGCLSVPGLTAVVRRHHSVRVTALDEHGRPFSAVYSGWPARIVQHELDHLAGVLYLDRAEARSISTVDNFVTYWSGQSPAVAASALGFEV